VAECHRLLSYPECSQILKRLSLRVACRFTGEACIGVTNAPRKPRLVFDRGYDRRRYEAG
jgi:hypothetical protein